jgi:hypothetical protein
MAPKADQDVHMKLKPATFPILDDLLNIVIKEFPVTQRFVCYNCGTQQSSKLLSAGTAPTGKKIRICLACRELYIQSIVKEWIDKVIVPALARQYMESLKPSADTPLSNASRSRASLELARRSPKL